jgi:hypothetical protein
LDPIIGLVYQFRYEQAVRRISDLKSKVLLAGMVFLAHTLFPDKKH